MLYNEMTYFILNLNKKMMDQICIKGGHLTFAGPIKLPTPIISSGPRVEQLHQGTVSDDGLFSYF